MILRKGAYCISICYIYAVFVACAILLPAKADTASATDIFASPGSRAKSDLSRRWSHFCNQQSGHRQGGSSALSVRDKWALLIGVSRYQDNDIKPLRIARNDVQIVSTALKDPAIGRFPSDHVATLVGRAATKEAILDAVLNSSLVKNALPNDLILLYFSGRTLPLAQSLCLCTYDTLLSKPNDSGVNLVEILSILQKRTQCGQIVCILDCASVSKDAYARMPAISIEELAKQTGVTVISASKFDEDCPACNSGVISSFALNFFEGMKDSVGALSLGALVSYVQENLNKESKDLGTATQEVGFSPTPTNIRAGDIILGVRPKNAASGSRLSVGYSPTSLAMDRPDLIYTGGRKRFVSSQPQMPALNDKTVEDENEARFSQVNFSTWMDKMRRDIAGKWHPPQGLEQRRVATTFTVRSDGSITHPAIVESSSIAVVDQSALDALKAASPLTPLPLGAPSSVDLRYVFDRHIDQ